MKRVLSIFDRPLSHALQVIGPTGAYSYYMASHMIANDEEIIETVVRRIVEASHPDKVVLFGSRARGDASGRSDYDLLVIMESSEPGFRRDAPIYLALAGVSAPVDVLVYTPQEISEWSAVPQAFITTAMREGRVLYERQR